MRRQGLRDAHAIGLLRLKIKLSKGTCASPKSSHGLRNLPAGRTLEPWAGEMGRTRINPGLKGPQQNGLPDMTQQWEATVSDEEKPNEKARAIRARQRAIGRELRRMYDDVAQEPVPDDFMDLLQQIDEAEGSKGGKKVS